MAVGAGLQSTVAIINLCCFYLIGVPIGALLGYVAHLQVKVKVSLRSNIVIDFPIALISEVVRTLQKSSHIPSRILKKRVTFGGSDTHLSSFMFLIRPFATSNIFLLLSGYMDWNDMWSCYSISCLMLHDMENRLG